MHVDSLLVNVYYFVRVSGRLGALCQEILHFFPPRLSGIRQFESPRWTIARTIEYIFLVAVESSLESVRRCPGIIATNEILTWLSVIAGRVTGLELKTFGRLFIIIVSI